MIAHFPSTHFSPLTKVYAVFLRTCKTPPPSHPLLPHLNPLPTHSPRTHPLSSLGTSFQWKSSSVLLCFLYYFLHGSLCVHDMHRCMLDIQPAFDAEMKHEQWNDYLLSLSFPPFLTFSSYIFYANLMRQTGSCLNHRCST